MTRFSTYPRTCGKCGVKYGNRNSFFVHTKNGTCGKREALNTQRATTNQNTTIINNNYNAPDNAAEMKALEEKVKQLELQNQILEASSKNPLPLSNEDCGYIYVVRTKHASDLRVSVHKVGVTSQLKQRVPQYPFGAELIFCHKYEKAKKKELRLHQFLHSDDCNDVKARPDFGTEFYEADIYVLIKTIERFMDGSE